MAVLWEGRLNGKSQSMQCDIAGTHESADLKQRVGKCATSAEALSLLMGRGFSVIKCAAGTSGGLMETVWTLTRPQTPC